MICVSREQYAFIKGINILSEVLMLNKGMNLYLKREKQLLVFKVDFKNAYAQLHWDFLDVIMKKM